jgi:hypothetical protein
MIPGLEPVTLIRRRGEIDGATGLPDIAETKVPTYASIQPAEAETMERLPEGFRIEDVRILYMYKLVGVKAANPKTDPQTLADHFEFASNGVTDRWAVQVVPDWRMILPHYEVVVTRVKEQEEEA